MTASHIVGFKIDVFDNESRPLIKLFNRAMSDPNIISAFDAAELERLETFIDCFKDLALNS